MAISYRGIAIEIRKPANSGNGLTRGEYWFRCDGTARRAASIQDTVAAIDESLDDAAAPAGAEATCHGAR